MHPKIAFLKNILTALRYNEQKVAEGKAEKIGAENFLKDYAGLTKEDVIDRFRQRSSFNERLHDHGVHFSLNFGKLEKIDNAKLMRITERFMTGAGFEDQPYVAYRHTDAGHTHVHLVATTVQADGSPMDVKPRDYKAFVALCKQLENEYGLEKGIKLRPEDQREFAVDRARRVVYGEPGLKRAMSNVLNTVVDHYAYSSLGELNAILKQYNVEANAGHEGSRLRKVGGLLYHALDEDGKRIGVPIKASLFLLKPTMKHLEQRFAASQAQRERSRERIHLAIDWALAGRAPNWEEFRMRLEKDGISLVTDKNGDKGGTAFFVDHVEKAAFSDKGLGREYGLDVLRNKCAQVEQVTEEQLLQQRLNFRL